MADLTSDIRSIEEKLAALGLLAPAQVDGVADGAFFDAQNKAARFLAVVLKMPPVTGYTPGFGAQVLAHVAEKERKGELAKDIETIEKYADLKLSGSAFYYTPKHKIQGYLKDAKIPESQWGNIRLGGLLEFINEREQVVTNLNAIANDANVQAVQREQIAKAQSNTDTVLKAIGQEGKAWNAPQTQTALTQYLIKLQTDFGFPEEYRYGAFDAPTSKKLTEQLSAGTVPAGYDAAQLQALIPALDALRDSGDYKPPEKPLNAFDATLRVETALATLVPRLNTQLEDHAAKTDAQIDQIPQGFMRDLAAMFKDFATGGVLDRRIPPVGTPDGIFDMRSQASLQGMMMILSHSLLLGIPGEPSHVYTPEKGQFIRENFEKKLKGKVDDESLAQLQAILPDLLGALDYLAENGLISRELFLNPDNSIRQMPWLVQKQYAQRIETHQTDNPDMLRLLDSLTRTYTTNMGIAELMPDLEIPPLFDQVDGNQSARDRLAQFYKEARAKYDDKEKFEADVMVLIQTVVTLPYGDRDYRSGLEDAMIGALNAAQGEADPDKAAKIFTDTLTTAAVALHKTQKSDAPQYIKPLDRDVPVWKPGLASFTVTSGGKLYNVTNIAQAYDDYNFSEAQKDYQRQGFPNPAHLQKFMFFKDDDGRCYVAGIDRESMIFTIEPIDGNALFEKDKTAEGGRERIDTLREQDSGFALIVDRNGHVQGGMGAYTNIYKHARAENTPALDEVIKRYGDQAQSTHQENMQRLEDKTQWNPDLFIAPPEAHAAAASARQEHFKSAAGNVDQKDLEAIADFTLRKLYNGPVVLDPQQHRAVIDRLSRSAGKELDWGRSLQAGAQLRIKEIDVSDADPKGRMIAYYDRQDQTVRVIGVPESLRDAEGRKALVDSVYRSDDLTMMERVRSQHPELFTMMRRSYGQHDIPAGQALLPRDYLGFRKDFVLFMDRLDGQIRDPVLAVTDGYGQAPHSDRDARHGPRGVARALDSLGASVRKGFESLSEAFRVNVKATENEAEEPVVDKMRENGADITAPSAPPPTPVPTPEPVLSPSAPGGRP